MPPKGKKVHNTHSVSEVRLHSNNPLVVKVTNDKAKYKQANQAKSKLKSIVKVVNNTPTSATKKVSFCQGPANPVDNQPAAQPAMPQKQKCPLVTRQGNLLRSCRHRGRQVNLAHLVMWWLSAILRASLWERRWLCLLQPTHHSPISTSRGTPFWFSTLGGQ